MNIETAKSHGHLVAPHGGELVDLKLDQENAAELKACSKDFPSWDLTSRQIRDLELLLSGGFSPLSGFMRRDEYDLVRDEIERRLGLADPDHARCARGICEIAETREHQGCAEGLRGCDACGIICGG